MRRACSAGWARAYEGLECIGVVDKRIYPMESKRCKRMVSSAQIRLMADDCSRV